MIIATTNDLPGYEVVEVLGEVFGLTVRSRNIGSQIGAGLKSLVGGELSLDPPSSAGGASRPEPGRCASRCVRLGGPRPAAARPQRALMARTGAPRSR